MPSAAKPMSWLRAPSADPSRPEVDVELAGRQAGDAQDPADRARSSCGVRGRAVERALDLERLLPGRRVGAGRRDVEHAVGDRRRPATRGGRRSATTAIRVTVWRSTIADRDRREGDAAGRGPSARSSRPRRTGCGRGRGTRAGRRSAAFGRSGSRASAHRGVPAIRPPPRACARTARSRRPRPRRRRPPAAGRPRSMNSASRLGLGDLEVADRRRRGRRRPRGSPLGSALGAQLELGVARRPAGCRSTPSSGRQPGRDDARRRATIRIVRRPLARFRSRDRPPATTPAAVDDRDRFAQRLGGLHLVGREDEGPALGRAARGTPRAGSRG